MQAFARLRFAVALPAIAALVCGVLAGLARLGVTVPSQVAGLSGMHGPLMIGGFFGTLIGLERAVALARGWAFLGPLASGVGALVLVLDPASTLPAWLMFTASVVMTVACASVWLHERAAHLATLALGALSWALGNLAWAASGVFFDALPLWTAFLILTIAGERLELSRFLPTPRSAHRAFALIAALVLGGAALSVVSGAGPLLYALGLLALAGWLLRYDVARHTVRQRGLTRYIAWCLLSGYAWLGVAALLGLGGALSLESPLRDAALHALLLGFVFAMVFGHAPIILPAVTKLKLRWHAGFYLPLIALHLTLAWRIAGVVLADVPMRQHALVGNALVLVLFVGMVIEAVLAQRRAGPAPRRAAGGGHARHTGRRPEHRARAPADFIARCQCDAIAPGALYQAPFVAGDGSNASMRRRPREATAPGSTSSVPQARSRPPTGTARQGRPPSSHPRPTAATRATPAQSAP